MTTRIRIFIAGLFASMALLFTTAAPALAAQGDWYTQLQVTSRNIATHCSLPSYYTSGEYTSNTRAFVYNCSINGARYCYQEYIGNTYSIFAITRYGGWCSHF